MEEKRVMIIIVINYYEHENIICGSDIDKRPSGRSCSALQHIK